MKEIEKYREEEKKLREREREREICRRKGDLLIFLSYASSALGGWLEPMPSSATAAGKD
jgi:hypothetical protein